MGCQMALMSHLIWHPIGKIFFRILCHILKHEFCETRLTSLWRACEPNFDLFIATIFQFSDLVMTWRHAKAPSKEISLDGRFYITAELMPNF